MYQRTPLEGVSLDTLVSCINSPPPHPHSTSAPRNCALLICCVIHFKQQTLLLSALSVLNKKGMPKPRGTRETVEGTDVQIEKKRLKIQTREPLRSQRDNEIDTPRMEKRQRNRLEGER